MYMDMRDHFSNPLNQRYMLVPVPGGVVFGTDHQTTAFLRAPVDRLDDVDEFLFVFSV